MFSRSLLSWLYVRFMYGYMLLAFKNPKVAQREYHYSNKLPLE